MDSQLSLNGQQPGCQGTGGVGPDKWDQELTPNPEEEGRLTTSSPGVVSWSTKASRLLPSLQREAAQFCLGSSPWFPTRNWELCAFYANTAAAVAGQGELLDWSLCMQVAYLLLWLSWQEVRNLTFRLGFLSPSFPGEWTRASTLLPAAWFEGQSLKQVSVDPDLSLDHSFICSFVHSFDICLLSAYDIPCTRPCGHKVNKREKDNWICNPSRETDINQLIKVSI